jgi:hypothetical protein
MAMPRLAAFAVVLITVALAGGRVVAQEPPPPPPPPPPEAKVERSSPRADRSAVTLRVQLVLSRLQGEKKTGSLPYTFTATTSGEWTRMRMGVDTPIPTGPMKVVAKDAGESPAVPVGFQYRSVGTNIDCRARDLGDGRYALFLKVENSSAMTGAEAAQGSLLGAPLFRRFEFSVEPVLRDGQSIQTVASTDPVTGEVVKIDVTMNVVK